MTPADRQKPLAPGSEVAGFIVDEAVAQDRETIIYRAHDARSGTTYLLREFAPAGLTRRSVDGDLVPSDEAWAGPLAIGIASFLAAATRAATFHHESLSRSIRSFRARGTAYEVLGCPPGRLLAERLAETRPLGAQETAAIARRVLDALEFLHARQRLHGEIGPQRVLLPETGGAVLIVGVAETPGPRPDRPTPSQRGSGTAVDPYAPVEQSDPGAGPGSGVGPWTDVYRLAATLYHCLAGRPPALAVARRAAMEAGEPDPLAPLPDLPDHGAAGAELHTLIRRGLQLAPASRPRSLREWRARIADIGTESAAGAEAAPRTGARASRRFPALLAGLLLAVLVAGGIYLLSLERLERGVQPTGISPAAAARSALEAERWRQALEANAVIGYRSFIDDFPDSPRVGQAREYIDRLEAQAWPAVLAENTPAAFEAHLDVFPDGRFATEARARIEAFRQQEARVAREAAERARRDEAAWQAARSAGSVAALDEYLAEWAGGAFADEARALRERLQAQRNDTARFERARAAGTIAAWRGYLADYPAGRHVQAALEAIDRLTLRPGKRFRDCSGCPEMIVVPAGSFWQGSADASPLAISLEKPRRRVVIGEPFAIGAREVTMRQWDACAAAGGCERRPEDNGWGRGRRPVIGVSWNDANQYAEWLSGATGQAYALPSESQWEYAARAGEESDWLGGTAEAVCGYGNIAGTETDFGWRHDGCGDRMAASTAIAGSFKPNAFGLFDVIGNVAEWTLDCMNLSYLEAPTDGTAWSRGLCSSRMTRGGSWFSGTRDVRLPARFNLKAGDRNDFTGFRIVRRVEPAQE